MNYTSLVADIQAYVERGGSSVTDPTVNAQIPRVINAAERRLAQMLKLLGQIEVLVDVTGLAKGLAVYSKPDRWRKTVSMNYGAGTSQNNRTQLYPRSYEYCRSFWPDDSQTAPPMFYSDIDINHWLVVPTPDLTYPLEILAYMLPPLLDASNQNNFFSIYTPNALLYCAMVEMAVFLKDDTRAASFEKMFNLELQSLDVQDLGRIMDRGSDRKAP